MSGRSLLDVNVLVALFNPAHTHHDTAHDWFADHRSLGWATCPITENGFVRVLSNPASGSSITRPAALVALLRSFCQSPEHEFWPDILSLSDEAVFDLSCVGSHRHLTDVYLLGLATKHRGQLVTFDRSIPVKAVIGAKATTLAVIAPAD